MEFVTKEIRNHIAYITIDRPPVNALNRQAYSELTEAFNSVYDDLDDVFVVILTGRGKQFIAGNDLNEFTGTAKSDMNTQSGYFASCLTNIYTCPVPVIGAINGAAVGAGFCIASVCDVLVAAEGARFGLTEMKVGVLGGLAFLPGMVPQKLGKYMTLTGNLIPAEKLEMVASESPIHAPSSRVSSSAYGCSMPLTPEMVSVPWNRLLCSMLFVSVPVSVSVCGCAKASSSSAYSVTVCESSTGVCVGTTASTTTFKISTAIAMPSTAVRWRANQFLFSSPMGRRSILHRFFRFEDLKWLQFGV